MFEKKWNFSKNPRRDAFIVSVILAIFSCAFGAALVYHAKAMRQSYAALEWNVCPVVKVEEVRKVENQKPLRHQKNTTRKKVTTTWICHYVYGGQSYQTKTMGLGDLYCGEVPRSLNDWQVYVNPDNPSEAVISPGGCTKAWVFLGALALIALALVVGFVWSSIYYTRRYAGKSRVL